MWLPSFILRLLSRLESPETCEPVLVSQGLNPDNAKVTVVSSIVVQEKNAVKALRSLVVNADFPSKYVVLIRPGLDRALRWCKRKGFEVWEGFLTPIIVAKHWLVSQVDTPFCLLQDCDCFAQTPFLPLYEEMVKHPELATISPILEHGKSMLYGSQILREYGCVIRHRLKNRHIKGKSTPYFVDYSTLSSVLIRMEAFKEHPFDTKYGMGYAHEDWFMQFLHSDWDSAVHKGVRTQEIRGMKPLWYLGLRYNPKSTERSRKRFEEKWGRLVVP